MRFHILKLVLATVALVPGTYKGLQGLHVAFNEPQPTELAAGDFPDGYTGQRHVRVQGRIALEHVGQHPHSQDERGRVKLRAARAPEDGWTRDQAVHVVAAFGSRPPAEVEAWISDAKAWTAVQGVVGPPEDRGGTRPTTPYRGRYRDQPRHRPPDGAITVFWD